jgi:hypothetical protein
VLGCDPQLTTDVISQDTLPEFSSSSTYAAYLLQGLRAAEGVAEENARAAQDFRRVNVNRTPSPKLELGQRVYMRLLPHQRTGLGERFEFAVIEGEVHARKLYTV